MKFRRELYSKTALMKASYNFTDKAYVHLDADDGYYYVEIEPKDPDFKIDELDFTNEMLAQAVRHEVYRQTRNIRELLLARAMATSVIIDEELADENEESGVFAEDEILRDWFAGDEGHEN